MAFGEPDSAAYRFAMARLLGVSHFALKCGGGTRKNIIHLKNRGSVTTQGADDMVLYNWGVVDRWAAEAHLTPHA
jgi:hypothetical protein